MLTEEQKIKVRENDILSDFDGTMIRGESTYRQIFAYFSYLSGDKRISFLKKLIKNFHNCRKRDIVFFYSMLEGCPVKILDNLASQCKENERWTKLIERRNLNKIGIISRNSSRFINEYLNFKEYGGKADIVAANEPEIVNDIYTGGINSIVTNNTLIDFVREKDYIHGKDEKKILESFGDSEIHIIDVGHGLYICSKRKIF